MSNPKTIILFAIVALTGISYMIVTARLAHLTLRELRSLWHAHHVAAGRSGVAAQFFVGDGDVFEWLRDGYACQRKDVAREGAAVASN